jgi:ABC-type uncharacterized transport system fused permease/ATPase subunit
VSLKELICLPDAVETHSDVEVGVALGKAGLSELVSELAEYGRDGQSWDQLLSGGQKQKVVLARIVLVRPTLLFLDEPTSALDAEATAAFHQIIRDNCPDVTVISVMHDATPPKTATGGEFFHSVLSIADRTVTKAPLVNLKGRPAGPARVRPRPEKQAWA